MARIHLGAGAREHMKRTLLLAADAEFVLQSAQRLGAARAMSVAAVAGPASLKSKLVDILGADVLFLADPTRDDPRLLTLIKNERIDWIFSVLYRWILPAEAIEAVSGNAFNIHLATLPDYRGTHTTIFPILNGESQCGVTLHWMTPEVDMGDKILGKVLDIAPDDSGIHLESRLKDAALECIGDFVQLVDSGKELPRIPLPPGGMFYKKESIFPLKRIVDPTDVVELDRKARAFNYPPHEPAYILRDGKKYYIIAGKGGWLPTYG